MFVTWNDERSQALAFHQASRALQRVEPIVRSHGSNIFSDIAPGNVSIRDGFDRQDYENYRTGEMLPVKSKDIMAACLRSYDRIGLVKNVVDLMADFATQGIGLYHPNERIEKWHKEWFRRINARERSERFLNLLYRTGNVLIRRQFAKIPVKVEEEMRRATADMDADIPVPDQKVEKRQIPWKYIFLNPLAVEVMSEELAVFVGPDAFVFGLKIPKPLGNKIRTAKGKHEKAMLAKIPSDIRELVTRGESFIPLDMDKVKAFYYKKDDWEVWAKPMLYSVLSDLNLLQKMKLADLAALDGAISCIRVWKLGSLDHKIMPTEVAINRLAEMLMNNVGGGVMDLVWGPEIDLVETSTEVHKFLGNNKYEPVLNAIFQGLGVPPSLAGNGTGGFTNNFISLKTLTERLEYGRQILRMFWEEELRIVQKAMGFRFPATLVFDRMVLSDEAAEKQLLINLADRDIISWECIIERFGENPEIEEARLRREARKRKNGQMPKKADPFHDGQQDFGLKKIFAQTGVISPSQAGVELEEQEEGDKSLLEQTADQQVKQAKIQNQATQQQNDHQFRTEKLQLKHGVHPAQVALNTPTPGTKKGQPGQGRPKNSNDTKPRKQKRVTPRTSASFFEATAWASNAQAKILQVLGPAYLKSVGKTTHRELTEEQSRNFEELRFRTLCQFDIHDDLDKSSVVKAATGSLEVPTQVMQLLRATVAKHVEANNSKEPPVETLRGYQAGVYAFWKGEYEDEEAGDSADVLS
jgi:hypothetical protein